MRGIFVAGTDTGVGKSVVTGLLAGSLLASGRSVVTQKWVQTGCNKFSEDIDIHLKFMRKKRKDYASYLDLMAPYRFRFPGSPHLASRLEKNRIKAGRIKRSLKSLSDSFDFVVAEGSGGLMVPLNDDTLLIDVIKDIDMPVLLVAGNRLGAINHTLMSIEALRSRHIKIIGVIFNTVSTDVKKAVLKDNPGIVKRIARVNVLGALPYIKNIGTMNKKFAPIGKRIIAGL